MYVFEVSQSPRVIWSILVYWLKQHRVHAQAFIVSSNENLLFKTDLSGPNIF